MFARAGCLFPAARHIVQVASVAVVNFRVSASPGSSTILAGLGDFTGTASRAKRS